MYNPFNPVSRHLKQGAIIARCGGGGGGSGGKAIEQDSFTESYTSLTWQGGTYETEGAFFSAGLTPDAFNDSLTNSYEVDKWDADDSNSGKANGWKLTFTVVSDSLWGFDGQYGVKVGNNLWVLPSIGKDRDDSSDMITVGALKDQSSVGGETWNKYEFDLYVTAGDLGYDSMPIELAAANGIDFYLQSFSAVELGATELKSVYGDDYLSDTSTIRSHIPNMEVQLSPAQENLPSMWNTVSQNFTTVTNTINSYTQASKNSNDPYELALLSDKEVLDISDLLSEAFKNWADDGGFKDYSTKLWTAFDKNFAQTNKDISALDTLLMGGQTLGLVGALQGGNPVAIGGSAAVLLSTVVDKAKGHMSDRGENSTLGAVPDVTANDAFSELFYEMTGRGLGTEALEFQLVLEEGFSSYSDLAANMTAMSNMSTVNESKEHSGVYGDDFLQTFRDLGFTVAIDGVWVDASNGDLQLNTRLKVTDGESDLSEDYVEMTIRTNEISRDKDFWGVARFDGDIKQNWHTIRSRSEDKSAELTLATSNVWDDDRWFAYFEDYDVHSANYQIDYA